MRRKKQVDQNVFVLLKEENYAPVKKRGGGQAMFITPSSAELGCGTGLVGLAAARLGAKVLLTDIQVQNHSLF